MGDHIALSDTSRDEFIAAVRDYTAAISSDAATHRSEACCLAGHASDGGEPRVFFALLGSSEADKPRTKRCSPWQASGSMRPCAGPSGQRAVALSLERARPRFKSGLHEPLTKGFRKACPPC